MPNHRFKGPIDQVFSAVEIHNHYHGAAPEPEVSEEDAPTMSQPAPEPRVFTLRGVLQAIGLSFILVCVFWAVAVQSQNGAAAPATLSSGGLEGRVWKASEVPSGINATAKQLRALERALVEAERKGDFTLALDVMSQSTKVLATWNDQDESTKQTGRNCWLAAMHLSTGAQAAANGQAWATRAQFKSALADCQP